MRKRTHGWLWGLQLEAGESLYNCGEVREEKVHHHSDKGQVALDADHLERERLLRLLNASTANRSVTLTEFRPVRINDSKRFRPVLNRIIEVISFELAQLNFVVFVSIIL